MTINEQYEKIKTLADQIYANPELGYKETKTKQTIVEYLKNVHPEIQIEEFSTTGFKTTLGEKKPVHIAFIAELDAVYAPSHFKADPTNGAAHNCGHYTQVAIALALYEQLYATKAYEAFDFQLSFIFVPAEEYLDLPYREQLVKEGIITHYGGKPEAMKLGVFDDIDLGICVHAIGGEFDERTIEINCDLAGFLYKKYHFKGKASHAGFDPFSSVNAYSMSTLFNTAIGLSRQQLDEKQMVRINPIVMQSDMSTNVIPNHITVGTDLRTQSVDYMQEVAIRLDQAATGSAQALMGEVDVETQMGYLPFQQSRYLSTFVASAFNKDERIKSMLNNQAISAAGDIGDLSYMMPCIQIGYSGFTGTIHGDDFIDVDPEFIYTVFPSFLQSVLKEMVGQIDQDKLYKKSYQDYLKVLDTLAK
ncbi:amidohydrolase [Halolactibacillus miurensis]|uniref:Amidohydrolase n=1 Tax=Halolactibacillus miurensis TaxID=306541 RepID=A0A1I6NZR0_9BACI|nr:MULTISPECIES: M20/M25/M40 family metallo-hydrolase [Halolactibacillus]GEM04800.1 amidohydrolase [Halolactibacillus miurensis]SFS33325.1 amidohydrolase [Halolactibacillus miurensis]